jgi:hypothetical protein
VAGQAAQPAVAAPAYADPINPAVDINDYLFVQDGQVAVPQTVAWDLAVNGGAPSAQRSRFVLPKVGLLSRLFVEYCGVFDLTVGTGACAVAADGRGPHGLIDGYTLRVNGGSGWYDVSGFGTYIINAATDPDNYPETATGSAYTTAPTDVASTLFDYPVVDGTPRWGHEIPVALSGSQPCGMILLQNDQTTVELEIRWANLAQYCALTGNATATLELTASVSYEYFDIPERAAFQAFILPMLQWAHWWTEEREDITATGRGANVVVLDNHDTYLRVVQQAIINSVIDTDHFDELRLVLNRKLTRYSKSLAKFLRTQRHNTGGKDLPAFVWDWFSTGTLRDALHADAYTDIRLELDIATGTTLGTAYFLTAAEKLVDLGSPPVGVV